MYWAARPTCPLNIIDPLLLKMKRISEVSRLVVSDISLIAFSYRGPHGNVARSVLFAVLDR
jgi:hypothetical protein